MLTGIAPLHTERLILRAPSAQDFPAFAAYFMSERARFTGGQPDRILAWNRFCVTLGHWHMRGYGVFVMVRRDTGAVIGAAGPFYPEGWPEPEIAWQLWDGTAEGHGFAQEGARAARAHVYDDLGWTTVVSLIAPDNTRSRALAQRLGCWLDGTHPHPHFGPLEIWRHPAA
ncbi:GNAT family N-acetyltransferase [Roseinatronobacter sp.]